MGQDRGSIHPAPHDSMPQRVYDGAKSGPRSNRAIGPQVSLSEAQTVTEPACLHNDQDRKRREGFSVVLPN
jgi:hypothetical protein